MGEVSRIINFANRTITEADVGDVWDEELDFDLCDSLEVLEIKVRMGLTQQSSGTIRDVARALATLPISILRLRIVVDFVFFGPDLLHLPWSELDRSLVRRKNLQTVELVLLNEGGTVDIDVDTKEHLSSFFPYSLRGLSDVLKLSFN